MKYAVELYFDKAIEEKLNQLIQKVADEKLSTEFLKWNTRPHLTLACFNDVDEEKCIRLLDGFAEKHEEIPVSIGSVGMFNDTKTIFVSPVMTESMYLFHRELYECLSCFDTTGWEWYCPDRWVPHCTVALPREDVPDIFYKTSILILKEFKKLSGKFTSIGLGKIACPVCELYMVNLGAKQEKENS